MDAFDTLAAPEPAFDALAEPVAPPRGAGVYTGWRRTRAGPIVLEAAAEHRIRIHSSGPVRGRCGEIDFLYTRGDMDLLPAGYTDAWSEESDSVSLYLGLAPRLLREAAEELGLRSAQATPVVRWQFRDRQIEHIAWALDDEHRSGYANGRLYADSLGLALALRLLRRETPAAAAQPGLPLARLRRLTGYIEAHLDQPLSLAELAGVAELSSSHLKTLFRRSTGLPVHQYVLQRRVEHARSLLLHSDRPISQVALDAGFSHQSHLARCMQKQLGTSPAALRRKR